jgi:predicted XRE-type DNA-binding protein
MSKKITNSILDELAEDPAEAMQLKLKSRLMNAIISNIHENDMTQAEAAILMQVQRTRVNDVCNGRIDKMTIDALVAMAARLGIDPLRSVA